MSPQVEKTGGPSEYPKIAMDIKYNYYAGETSFNCPCGERGIYMDESGQTYKCECGRLYRLRYYVEFEEPES